MNLRIRTLVLLSCSLSIATLGACSSLQRSSASGYRDHDEATPTQPRERVTSSDDGDPSLTRARLERAEQDLEGKREREQYFKNKPYMKSDRDRLEFLSLDTYEARQNWLATKGSAASPQFTQAIQALIDANDISLGMPKQAVKDSWGEPELVEVSGNPIYGNERWHYQEQTSSTEGYHSQSRVVYFESGRVVGWETH